ncbi:MAG: insulinase family protein, partial [Proteobacteria bacterium]|nr:insulinase family protein [Pseudomonadota bacterium]
MYQITTLKNGLRVATELLPGVESVAVALTSGVGSRYESEKENGISHLLEHMAFKGTKTRTALDIAQTFDNIGGQMNAYTSMELTVYYAKVLAADTRLAVDILADILQNSTIDEKELAREKDVVIQEIAMHRDTPDDLIMDFFDEAAFPNQPMGRSILSTEERVNSHSRDDIFAYLAKHYRTPRLVLTAAGKVKHEEFVKLAEEYFTLGQQPAGPDFDIAKYVGGTRMVNDDLERALA